MDKGNEAIKAKTASKFSKLSQLSKAGTAINQDLNVPKRSVTKIAYVDRTPPDSRQQNRIYTASSPKLKNQQTRQSSGTTQPNREHKKNLQEKFLIDKYVRQTNFDKRKLSKQVNDLKQRQYSHRLSAEDIRDSQQIVTSIDFFSKDYSAIGLIDPQILTESSKPGVKTGGFSKHVNITSKTVQVDQPSLSKEEASKILELLPDIAEGFHDDFQSSLQSKQNDGVQEAKLRRQRRQEKIRALSVTKRQTQLVQNHVLPLVTDKVVDEMVSQFFDAYVDTVLKKPISPQHGRNRIMNGKKSATASRTVTPNRQSKERKKSQAQQKDATSASKVKDTSNLYVAQNNVSHEADSTAKAKSKPFLPLPEEESTIKDPYASADPADFSENDVSGPAEAQALTKVMSEKGLKEVNSNIDKTPITRKMTFQDKHLDQMDFSGMIMVAGPQGLQPSIHEQMSQIPATIDKEEHKQPIFANRTRPHNFLSKSNFSVSSNEINLEINALKKSAQTNVLQVKKKPTSVSKDRASHGAAAFREIAPHLFVLNDLGDFCYDVVSNKQKRRDKSGDNMRTPSPSKNPNRSSAIRTNPQLKKRLQRTRTQCEAQLNLIHQASDSASNVKISLHPSHELQVPLKDIHITKSSQGRRNMIRKDQSLDKTPQKVFKSSSVAFAKSIEKTKAQNEKRSMIMEAYICSDTNLNRIKPNASIKGNMATDAQIVRGHQNNSPHFESSKNLVGISSSLKNESKTSLGGKSANNRQLELQIHSIQNRMKDKKSSTTGLQTQNEVFFSDLIKSEEVPLPKAQIKELDDLNQQATHEPDLAMARLHQIKSKIPHALFSLYEQLIMKKGAARIKATKNLIIPAANLIKMKSEHKRNRRSAMQSVALIPSKQNSKASREFLPVDESKSFKDHSDRRSVANCTKGRNQDSQASNYGQQESTQDLRKQGKHTSAPRVRKVSKAKVARQDFTATKKTINKQAFNHNQIVFAGVDSSRSVSREGEDDTVNDRDSVVKSVIEQLRVKQIERSEAGYIGAAGDSQDLNAPNDLKPTKQGSKTKSSSQLRKKSKSIGVAPTLAYARKQKLVLQHQLTDSKRPKKHNLNESNGSILRDSLYTANDSFAQEYGTPGKGNTQKKKMQGYPKTLINNIRSSSMTGTCTKFDKVGAAKFITDLPVSASTQNVGNKVKSSASKHQHMMSQGLIYPNQFCLDSDSKAVNLIKKDVPLKRKLFTDRKQELKSSGQDLSTVSQSAIFPPLKHAEKQRNKQSASRSPPRIIQHKRFSDHDLQMIGYHHDTFLVNRENRSRLNHPYGMDERSQNYMGSQEDIKVGSAGLLNKLGKQTDLFPSQNPVKSSYHLPKETRIVRSFQNTSPKRHEGKIHAMNSSQLNQRSKQSVHILQNESQNNSSTIDLDYTGPFGGNGVNPLVSQYDNHGNDGKESWTNNFVYEAAIKNQTGSKRTQSRYSMPKPSAINLSSIQVSNGTTHRRQEKNKYQNNQMYLPAATDKSTSLRIANESNAFNSSQGQFTDLAGTTKKVNEQSLRQDGFNKNLAKQQAQNVRSKHQSRKVVNQSPYRDFIPHQSFLPNATQNSNASKQDQAHEAQILFNGDMMGDQLKQKKKSNLTLTQQDFRKKMSVNPTDLNEIEKSGSHDSFSPPESHQDIHSEIHSKEIETLEDDPLLAQKHPSIATYQDVISGQRQLVIDQAIQ